MQGLILSFGNKKVVKQEGNGPREVKKLMRLSNPMEFCYPPPHLPLWWVNIDKSE